MNSHPQQKFPTPTFRISPAPPPSATPANWSSATSATFPSLACKAASIFTKAIPRRKSFPIRVFTQMGVRTAILTNAAGGIKREFVQGQLVVIKDHINLQGVSPLTGPNDDNFGPRFPDMTIAYDRR